MAVCIVDVDSEHTPTIQYGNMYVSSLRVADVGVHTGSHLLTLPLLSLVSAGIESIRPSTTKTQMSNAHGDRLSAIATQRVR